MNGLSQREQQVAELVAEGLSNKEIAELLKLSRASISRYLNHIYLRLHFDGGAYDKRIMLCKMVWEKQNGEQGTAHRNV